MNGLTILGKIFHKVSFRRLILKKLRSRDMKLLIFVTSTLWLNLLFAYVRSKPYRERSSRKDRSPGPSLINRHRKISETLEEYQRMLSLTFFEAQKRRKTTPNYDQPETFSNINSQPEDSDTNVDFGWRETTQMSDYNSEDSPEYSNRVNSNNLRTSSDQRHHTRHSKTNESPSYQHPIGNTIGRITPWKIDTKATVSQFPDPTNPIMYKTGGHRNLQQPLPNIPSTKSPIALNELFDFSKARPQDCKWYFP